MPSIALFRNWGGRGVLINRPAVGLAFAIGVFVGIAVHAGISWPAAGPGVTASAEAKRQTPIIVHVEDSLSRSEAFLAPDSVPHNPRNIGSLMGTSSILETINSAVVRVSTDTVAGSGGDHRPCRYCVDQLACRRR